MCAVKGSALRLKGGFPTPPFGPFYIQMRKVTRSFPFKFIALIINEFDYNVLGGVEKRESRNEEASVLYRFMNESCGA